METIIKRTEIAQNDREIGLLVSLLMQVYELDGDMAEVGVYKGGSAWLINKIAPHKKLHLFDTFNGFNNLTEHDPNEWVNDKTVWENELGHVYHKVCDMFKEKNVSITRGSFPESVTEDIKNTKFCFVHLDADAYKVTKESLEFFYPRMVEGGLILLHDYNHIDIPVKKVTDEFMVGKPEGIVSIDTSQAFIVKK